MPTAVEQFGAALTADAGAFGIQPDSDVVARLCDYYELLLKWNSRLHLVAPCTPAEFATRHVLESLVLLRHLPQNARVVDVGSGAGLPIIPCLIARPDLHGTLIESSQKKSVFLREALRLVGANERIRLVAARFEETVAPEADFVTSRALDRFQDLLPSLIDWAPKKSKFLLFAGEALRSQIETLLPSARAELLPKSERRFLIIASRQVSV
ncbi:MAG TPA: 16S rRNA (guanine(527)-N(7))-methyltransferase RsmG [Pyrinomonadaceae bacterium]|nr:16S rRNA (guanine(527)-N(7))-methyltransferase RsmG [Pyrinomonadaceae bacterium]